MIAAIANNPKDSKKEGLLEIFKCERAKNIGTVSTGFGGWITGLWNFTVLLLFFRK